MGSEVSLLEFESKFCCVLAVWPWARYMASLYLHSFAYDMRTVIGLSPPQCRLRRWCIPRAQKNIQHLVLAQYQRLLRIINLFCLLIHTMKPKFPQKKIRLQMKLYFLPRNTGGKHGGAQWSRGGKAHISKCSQFSYLVWSGIKIHGTIELLNWAPGCQKDLPSIHVGDKKCSHQTSTGFLPATLCVQTRIDDLPVLPVCVNHNWMEHTCFSLPSRSPFLLSFLVKVENKVSCFPGLFLKNRR